MEGNLRSRSVFVQRERNNLGSRPAIEFAYSLVRNGLYSFRFFPNFGGFYDKSGCYSLRDNESD